MSIIGRRKDQNRNGAPSLQIETIGYAQLDEADNHVPFSISATKEFHCKTCN